jgi:hypothetical protein
MPKSKNEETAKQSEPGNADQTEGSDSKAVQTEWGGPKGKEPTRYGDWEKSGRCIDF